MRSAQWVAERVPDTRLRHALTARLRRAVGARWVVALDYRLYTDDWGVRGHTEKLEVAVDLPQRLALRLQQRASLQGAADFYRERYTQQDAYMTRDRRLSDNLSGQLGAALTWTAGRIPGLGSIDLRVAADGLLWRYDEFDAPALSGRSTARLAPLGWVRGAVVQLGVEVRP